MKRLRFACGLCEQFESVNSTARKLAQKGPGVGCKVFKGSAFGRGAAAELGILGLIVLQALALRIYRLEKPRTRRGNIEQGMHPGEPWFRGHVIAG